LAFCPGGRTAILFASFSTRVWLLLKFLLTFQSGVKISKKIQNQKRGSTLLFHEKVLATLFARNESIRFGALTDLPVAIPYFGTSYLGYLLRGWREYEYIYIIFNWCRDNK
jgi:hypothetical protein